MTNRTKYLGSSDCAAVMGLSRWSTPLQVWAEKTGQITAPERDDLQLWLGKQLEDTVAKLFEKKTGKKTKADERFSTHSKYDFIACEIDRWVEGEESSILECKTASAWKAKEWANEEIPQEYILQVYHQLACTGAKLAYIAVLIGNQDFKWQKIERNEEIINSIIKKEADFWNNFVVPKIMPMQMMSQDSDMLYQLFPFEQAGLTINLDDTAIRLIESIQALKQDKSMLQMTLDKQENELKAILGNAEKGESVNYAVTWKAQNSNRIDVDRLKKEEEEIYKQYLKTSSVRVLKIKNKEVKQ